MAEELKQRIVNALVNEGWATVSGDMTVCQAHEVAESVERSVVAPLAASFEERLSDVQVEYRKSRESWDRTRERLTVEGRLLLWLHAEAVALNEWYLKTGRIQQRWVDEDRAEVERLTAELARVEASRQAWAEEAMRLDQMLDEFRQLHHTAYVDEEHQGGNCVDLVLSLLSSRLRASGTRHSLDEVAAEFGERGGEEPSRPQCAVHPEGQGEIRAVPWTEEDAAAFEASMRPEGGE